MLRKEAGSMDVVLASTLHFLTGLNTSQDGQSSVGLDSLAIVPEFIRAVLE